MVYSRLSSSLVKLCFSINTRMNKDDWHFFGSNRNFHSISMKNLTKQTTRSLTVPESKLDIEFARAAFRDKVERALNRIEVGFLADCIVGIWHGREVTFDV